MKVNLKRVITDSPVFAIEKHARCVGADEPTVSTFKERESLTGGARQIGSVKTINRIWHWLLQDAAIRCLQLILNGSNNQLRSKRAKGSRRATGRALPIE